MQLDQTRIAIRERSFPEILDLALIVTRRHALPLLGLGLLPAVPLMMFNVWLCGDLLEDSAAYDLSYFGYLGYIATLGLLVAVEAPLVTAPLTLYLGRVLFVARPDFRSLAVDLLRALPQLILLQLMLRAMFVFSVMLLFWPYVIWPYLNEVILLERTRLIRVKTSGPSTLGRGWSLHAQHFGELFGRWVFSTGVAAGLILSLWMSMLVFASALTNQVELDDFTSYTVYLQLAIWLTVGYFAVVRFLSYLDLRIRTEGWEVELTMRAEATRLARSLT